MNININVVNDLLAALKRLGYDCQLVGGAAYTLYTGDTNTTIRDLDIRFPGIKNAYNAPAFAAAGIEIVAYLAVDAISSYRPNATRNSALNAEFEDRIKTLTKAYYKGVSVDLIKFTEPTLDEVLNTFDISFNCIAYDGTKFITSDNFSALTGKWLKPVTQQRYTHILEKFSHKNILDSPWERII